MNRGPLGTITHKYFGSPNQQEQNNQEQCQSNTSIFKNLFNFKPQRKDTKAYNIGKVIGRNSIAYPDKPIKLAAAAYIKHVIGSLSLSDTKLIQFKNILPIIGKAVNNNALDEIKWLHIQAYIYTLLKAEKFNEKHEQIRTCLLYIIICALRKTTGTELSDTIKNLYNTDSIEFTKLSDEDGGNCHNIIANTLENLKAEYSFLKKSLSQDNLFDAVEKKFTKLIKSLPPEEFSYHIDYDNDKFIENNTDPYDQQIYYKYKGEETNTWASSIDNIVIKPNKKLDDLNYMFIITLIINCYIEYKDGKLAKYLYLKHPELSANEPKGLYITLKLCTDAEITEQELKSFSKYLKDELNPYFPSIAIETSNPLKSKYIDLSNSNQVDIMGNFSGFYTDYTKDMHKNKVDPKASKYLNRLKASVMYNPKSSINSDWYFNKALYTSSNHFLIESLQGIIQEAESADPRLSVLIEVLTVIEQYFQQQGYDIKVAIPQKEDLLQSIVQTQSEPFIVKSEPSNFMNNNTLIKLSPLNKNQQKNEDEKKDSHLNHPSNIAYSDPKNDEKNENDVDPDDTEPDNSFNDNPNISGGICMQNLVDNKYYNISKLTANSDTIYLTHENLHDFYHAIEKKGLSFYQEKLVAYASLKLSLINQSIKLYNIKLKPELIKEAITLMHKIIQKHLDNNILTPETVNACIHMVASTIFPKMFAHEKPYYIKKITDKYSKESAIYSGIVGALIDQAQYIIILALRDHDESPSDDKVELAEYLQKLDQNMSNPPTEEFNESDDDEDLSEIAPIKNKLSEPNKLPESDDDEDLSEIALIKNKLPESFLAKLGILKDYYECLLNLTASEDARLHIDTEITFHSKVNPKIYESNIYAHINIPTLMVEMGTVIDKATYATRIMQMVVLFLRFFQQKKLSQPPYFRYPNIRVADDNDSKKIISHDNLHMTFSLSAVKSFNEQINLMIELDNYLKETAYFSPNKSGINFLSMDHKIEGCQYLSYTYTFKNALVDFSSIVSSNIDLNSIFVKHYIQLNNETQIATEIAHYLETVYENTKTIVDTSIDIPKNNKHIASQIIAVVNSAINDKDKLKMFRDFLTEDNTLKQCLVDQVEEQEKFEQAAE